MSADTRLSSAISIALERGETPEVIYCLLNSLADVTAETSSQAAMEIRRSAATLRPLFGTRASSYWKKLRAAAPMSARVRLPRAMPADFSQTYSRSELLWGRHLADEAIAAAPERTV